MTPEELDALEENLRNIRAVNVANNVLARAFNEAWQKRHNRTFMQACERSWRDVTNLKEHGGRYHKALDRWLAEQ